uniref:FYVE-type domain-containing protein n=1 Tax=Hyaloperonospora arabidopsidis (strain Emoy2) TaxID=559515 RepID=M4C053_HYAAE
MTSISSATSANEEVRLDIAEDRSPMLKFPVSPGCFHPTESKRQEFARIVQEHVKILLADEKMYEERRDRVLPLLDPMQWKQIQAGKELHLYKRNRRGRTLRDLGSEECLPDVRRAVENGYSSMVGNGQVQGSMEDMLYGLTASSQEDLMTGMWYKNPPRDCVWLGSVEGPTPGDPFHSADVIWLFPKQAYHADICYLKATGIEKDQDGKTYGYLVLHSVDLPHCRPFEARKISRAKMYFACLFREPTPGHLDVIVRGIVDLGRCRGKIAKKLVTTATKSFMLELFDGVAIGLAKKLTIMKRRNQNALQSPMQSGCSICFKTKRKLLFGLDTHLLQCGVCGTTVCSNCVANTKQILFLGPDAPCSKHACCLACMRDARMIRDVRPDEPEFQVIAEYYLTHRSQTAPALISPVRSLSSYTSYPLDTLTRKCRSGRHEYVMKSSGFADMRTNSTADDSIDTDPFSGELDEADFCSSDEESDSSIVAQPDPSSANLSGESDKRTLTIWKTHHPVVDDDFIPRSTSTKSRSDLERLHRTLFQLNITAQNTYMQTQATTRSLRGADLD